MSVLSASLSRAWTQPTQTPAFPGRIDLTDNTEQRVDIPSIEIEDAEPVSPQVTRDSTHVRRISTIRNELARRKYSKYTEDRYREAGQSKKPELGSRLPSTVTWNIDDTREGANEEVSESNAAIVVDKAGKLRRGSRKVKGFLSAKKHRRRNEDVDSAIDILYENQRGWFFCGLPLYSAASLLNFDPQPWVTAYGEPSAVDTSTAQLPDPSWEWAWKTWYVDMSMDVDEQGWQYSFMFQKNFSWHGTHPWFHSFVRRRRWIRKRIKKHTHAADGRVEGSEDARNAHKLTPEYFSIHSAMSRASTRSDAASSINTGSSNLHNVTTTESTDIETIPDLIRRLKTATVDREKIHAVVRYMDQSGQDSYYLADEMSHITSLFLFQHSRRHLLTSMIKKLDELEKLADSANISISPKEEKQLESAPTTTQDRSFGESLAPSMSKVATQTDGPKERLQRKVADLRRAAEAADKQIRQLEYWSDIREMVQRGETAGGVDEHGGWDKSWEGIDASGPSSNKGKARAREVDPRHDPDEEHHEH